MPPFFFSSGSWFFNSSRLTKAKKSDHPRRDNFTGPFPPKTKIVLLLLISFFFFKKKKETRNYRVKQSILLLSIKPSPGIPISNGRAAGFM